MTTKPIDLQSLQAKTNQLAATTLKMALNQVYAERKGFYLNEFNLFMAHFNDIPNFIIFTKNK